MSRPFKTKGYPIVPIIFILFVIWNMIFMFKEKTLETLIGLATLLIGLAFYYIAKAFCKEGWC